METIKYVMSASLKQPPKLTKERIEEMYRDGRQRKDFYIQQLGGDEINIDDWRIRELNKLEPGV